MNIDWATKDIKIYKTDMLLVQSNPVEVYQLDLTDFHNLLRDIEESEQGIVYGYTHNYNPAVTVSGVQLAQVIEVIEPYTLTFEDGLYNVNIVGGNSNLSDRTNKNQVGVNTANSAGLQDSKSLQAGSFGGVIALDQVNGTSGITFPIGTRGTPVNNWQDAKAIAQKQNISTILIIGNATLGEGDDVSNLSIKGTNPLTSTLTVFPESITNNVYVRECFFSGALDGGTVLRECAVGNIDYFAGYMEMCALTSSTIKINGEGVLLNCVAGATCTSAPIIDATNSTGLAIRNFEGNLEIRNKHGLGQCHIGMTGVLTIDSTVDTGSILVYGDADIIDNSTGTFTLDDRTTGTPNEISDKVWSATTRDLTSGALTQEQHNKLMESATKKDVIIASQL